LKSAEEQMGRGLGITGSAKDQQTRIDYREEKERRTLKKRGGT